MKWWCNVADILFEIGRYLAFLGVFFFLLFGMAFLLFRQGLDRANLSLFEEDEGGGASQERNAIGLGETVLYLRARQHEASNDARLKRLGAQYRSAIVYPFYAGVWTFCSGLALMSATFGFVLFS